jgi:ribosomal-protein-alanine N-acetyltransferase
MLCENFFEKGILRKVTAGVMEANLGSRRAFEKNDFVIEGILQDHFIGSDGRYSNVIRYGKILHFIQGNDVK